MKKLYIAVLFALAGLASCSPAKYTVAVELSSPSKSGINLVGKSLSVAYVGKDSVDDSLFLAYVAEGFTGIIEEEYFDGEESVDIYTVDVEGDSVPKEDMLNLIMDTGTDVAFLFDVAPSGSVSVPSEVRLYVYDSMSKVDTVHFFKGNVTLGKWDVDLYGQVVGEKSAGIFSPSWSRENIGFYYFSSDKWNEAVEDASNYKFPEAIKLWLELVKSKDQYKAACAQYNIAAACYIMGQHQLALKWLDSADSNYSIPESASLRKKIKARQS